MDTHATVLSVLGRQASCELTMRRGITMPEKRIVEKVRKAKRAGRAPTTQAGQFVREEIHKIRRGEHGARSPEQTIAIGLSKARRAGVNLSPPRRGRTKDSTRK